MLPPSLVCFSKYSTSTSEALQSITARARHCCRLRQNLQVPSDGRAGDAPGASLESDAGRAQQYLRLPVESAKKLRWYDRPDLNNLVQLNLRDKNDLLGVNAALRQVSLSMKISYTSSASFVDGLAVSLCTLLCIASRAAAELNAAHSNW